VATPADELARVPLFEGLNRRQLNRLAREARTRRFAAGTPVVREGEMSGVGFFVIQDGRAAVTIGKKKIETLGPGDYFGELGLIVERPRRATVTAETALDCLDISLWALRRFAKANPDVLWNLLQRVVELLDEAESRARRAR
jgi:CRP-like cAMP-binding protein